MTYLYRAFDDSGRLLYVGITENLVNRFGPGGHEQAPWADQVESVTAERYLTRQAARSAELRAIKSENPRWNIASSPHGGAVRAELWRRSQDRWRAYDERKTAPRPQVGSPEWDRDFEQRFAQSMRLRDRVRSAETCALRVAYPLQSTQTTEPAPDPRGAA